MNTLIISYDLKKPGKDYTKVHNYIQSFPEWAKPLESFYIIKTNLTAQTVINQLLQHVDYNDKVIVIDVRNNFATWNNLPSEISEWIKINF